MYHHFNPQWYHLQMVTKNSTLDADPKIKSYPYGIISAFFKNYVNSFYGRTLSIFFFFNLLRFSQGVFTVWLWFSIICMSLICTIRKASSLVYISALWTNERHLGSSVCMHYLDEFKRNLTRKLLLIIQTGKFLLNNI